MSRPQIDHIRRPQLLAAAADVISERGLEATRIADVADRVGTSAPAVLYWFESKDQLLVEALTHNEEAYYEELSRALAPIDSPAERLRTLIASAAAGPDWRLWMEIWTRALRDERLREARQRLDDRWRGEISAIVAEGQRRGEFAGPDPERVALELSALIDGLAVQVTLGDRLVDAELLEATVLEVAERLLETELEPAAAEEAVA